MGGVLIIGAGGVGSVVAHKCAQLYDRFGGITLASRRVQRCEKVAGEIRQRTGRSIGVAQVDANNVKEVRSLIRKVEAEIVINVALPYQDLSIMEACLEAGADYLDTANYEEPEVAHFEYSKQWDYSERFKEHDLMAVLGCGFDPGVSNIFCAYAQKHLLDEIEYVDILDCNAGSHGYQFATNFNTEINIREVTQKVRHWSEGRWIETPAIIDSGSVHFPFEYPEVGKRESYLLYHEELESLAKNITGLRRIRFWMTFSQEYLEHLRVLRDVGMTRIDEVEYEGKKVVPLKFLKALLPDPASIGSGYTGKTVIGNVMRGTKDGKERAVYMYNVCDHAESFSEVGSQAVSYTTGVPAMIGALLVKERKWKGTGVFNTEQLDPDPFMDELGKNGLPWKAVDFGGELPE